MNWWIMKIRAYTGDGKKYDSTKRDWEDAKSRLGYSPFEGTLNVALSQHIHPSDLLEYDRVYPFKDFVCFNARVDGVKAHCCYSKGRKGEDISTFYVISPYKLRKTLNINTQSWVDIKLLKENR